MEEDDIVTTVAKKVLLRFEHLLCVGCCRVVQHSPTVQIMYVINENQNFVQ